jgi:hypothetical protein
VDRHGHDVDTEMEDYYLEQIASYRGLLTRIADDLQRELDVGGQMPTVFPDEIRAVLASA